MNVFIIAERGLIKGFKKDADRKFSSTTTRYKEVAIVYTSFYFSKINFFFFYLQYMSLMAELGEGPPPPQRNGAQNASPSDKFKSASVSGGLFDRSTVPRAILPPQIHLPTPPQLIPNTLPSTLWAATQSNKMPNPSFNLPPPVPSSQTNQMISQTSASSNMPPLTSTSWPPNMVPPPFPFCGPTTNPGSNNPMMPPSHWMATLGIPNNVATATTAIVTNPQDTITTTSSSQSANIATMQPNSLASTWQPYMSSSLPPQWQTPFPFPPASMPVPAPPTTASTTATNNFASVTPQLSSFLAAPPPPPPPLPISQ